MNMKKTIAMMLALGMMPMSLSTLAEKAPAEEAPAENAPAVEAQAEEAPAEAASQDAALQASIADTQKLDASYTLALNAINAENYDAAKEYLNVCFAYCDPQSNPAIYADLLLKRACIDVIEQKNDMALLSLDAAIRVQPDLADAYLVRTQVYAAMNDVDRSIENLEKYIELTKDTSLYETVAQLQEAKGDPEAAQAAYDKYVEGAGAEVQEAGFQSGLYKMQSGKFDEAIKAFEAYTENETYAPGAQYNIGICKMNMGDYAGAIQAFTASAEKGGEFDGLLYNRGVCALMNAEWESAAADFAASAEKESYANDANYNLAICRMQLGDYESAIALFTTLAGAAETKTDEGEALPVNDGVYYYRAACRAATGDLDGAIADYTTCIDHGYELAQTYYERAQLYAAKGDTENQNSDLQNSLKYAG